MNRSLILCFVALGCGACQQQKHPVPQPVNEAETTSVAVPAPQAANPTLPPARPKETHGSLPEGPIDPKGPQGAGQVVQSYAALLEQGRFSEARRLWTDGGSGSGLSEGGFADVFGKYVEIHGEIGAPGPMEGAAGSSYVDMPLRFYGEFKGGRPFSSTGTVTLRRVNDVPGSTEEQRLWRIYRIDMQPPL